MQTVFVPDLFSTLSTCYIWWDSRSPPCLTCIVVQGQPSIHNQKRKSAILSVTMSEIGKKDWHFRTVVRNIHLGKPMTNLEYSGHTNLRTHGRQENGQKYGEGFARSRPRCNERLHNTQKVSAFSQFRRQPMTRVSGSTIVEEFRATILFSPQFTSRIMFGIETLRQSSLEWQAIWYHILTLSI
jgi:hypothetical protein